MWVKRMEICNHHPEIKSQLNFQSRLQTYPQAFDASAAWLRRARHVSVPPASCQGALLLTSTTWVIEKTTAADV